MARLYPTFSLSLNSRGKHPGVFITHNLSPRFIAQVVVIEGNFDLNILEWWDEPGAKIVSVTGAMHDWVIANRQEIRSLYKGVL